MCGREAGRLSAEREVVGGLVLRALVGNLTTVEAAKLYYVDGFSPSEILGGSGYQGRRGTPSGGGSRGSAAE